MKNLDIRFIQNSDNKTVIFTTQGVWSVKNGRNVFLIRPDILFYRANHKTIMDSRLDSIISQTDTSSDETNISNDYNSLQLITTNETKRYGNIDKRNFNYKVFVVSEFPPLEDLL